MRNSEKTVQEKRDTLYRIVAVGIMSAVVFAGNYMSIPISHETRIHFGNSMCLLAALLFGGLNGGLSSGIGGAVYDLTNPLYILSAPYTFFSKFAMGWTAGMLNRRHFGNDFVRALISAVCGQIVYIILYLGKSFVKELYLGNPLETATAVMVTKAGASLLNGGIAVAVSIPLYFALKKALSASPFSRLFINDKTAAENVK